VTEHGNRERTSWPDFGRPAFLAIIVFISRYVTRGPVYYVDGPRLVQCIVNHTYVIQPPGYWLFVHLGGLFPAPSFSLQFLNEFCSAAAVAIIFLLCWKMNLDRWVACAASVSYGSIFFVWLAGDIHSSYALQMLFAPLLVYLLLNYSDRESAFRLLVCAGSERSPGFRKGGK
jgi:4-amino-4-deoxy-L-arabinose transferase-like glycosyltransferase